jgi:excisionase family DNA binding protein
VNATIIPTSPDPDGTNDQLLTIAQVAHRLNVEVRHIRRLVHERRIPFIKWGHLLRFDPDELDEWIDQYRCQSNGPRP